MTEDEETVARYYGVIRIEWPPPGGGAYSAMLGRLTSVYDAPTGKLITTCSDADVTVHAGAQGLVTASLTLFCDKDGEPLLDGDPVVKYGDALTGVFPFLVGEMRVRS